MDTPFQPLTATTPPPITPPGKKVGKFAASRMVVHASWNLLTQDKEMMLFPIMSGIVSVIATIILIVAYYVLVAGGDLEHVRALANGNATSDTSDVVELCFLFVFYIVTFFIATFFQAGVVSIVHGRINGHNLTFADGMRNATAHAGKLFLWSVLNATIGVVLRAIAERSRLLGRIVVSLLGAAWSILTYFVLPILMFEQLSLRDSLDRSGTLIKRSWGETAIVNIGVSLFFFVLTLIGIAVLAGSFLTGNAVVIVTALVLFVLYVLALAIIASTLSIIFKVVLFEYAAYGKLPEGFSPTLIESAFTAK